MTALSPREQELQSAYNAFYAVRTTSDLPARLYDEALGDAYPAEVATSGSCDWNLLGTLVSRLRLRPGQVLADLGCGTGGVGLWLARALAVELIGVDLSSTAVDIAQARRSHFVPPGGARFQVGTVRATGLPDRCAEGVVFVDVPGGAGDWPAALAEIHRVLVPGGRAVLTRSVRRGSRSEWKQQAEAAGFEIEHVDQRPEEPEIWRSLYHLWLAREADLRRELGDAQTDTLVHEASHVLPLLDAHRAIVATLRRPRPSASNLRIVSVLAGVRTLGRTGSSRHIQDFGVGLRVFQAQSALAPASSGKSRAGSPYEPLGISPRSRTLNALRSLQ
jgi:ubiquinone/menaquinone biosynthesis C-methylase UbiE